MTELCRRFCGGLDLVDISVCSNIIYICALQDYQGRENRVVIISCVRSSERFLEEDYKKGMGLMLQRKRYADSPLCSIRRSYFSQG